MPRVRGSLGELRRLAGTKDRRQPVHDLRRAEERRGIGVHRVRGERPPIERADGADPPRDRRARVSQRVLLREVAAELRVARGGERRASAREERGEPRQVTAVRADRVLGEMPFVTQMRDERLDQPRLGGGQLLLGGHGFLPIGRGRVDAHPLYQWPETRSNTSYAGLRPGERPLVPSGGAPHQPAKLQPGQGRHRSGERHRDGVRERVRAGTTRAATSRRAVRPQGARWAARGFSARAGATRPRSSNRSSAPRIIVAPSRISASGTSASGLVTGPGTANTSRPRSSA